MDILKVPKENRLVYIDALRSFAILMMLQGHFISALLSDKFKTKSNNFYLIWEYFRGITAPTFFTITGFIFMLLLLKHHEKGWNNPRIKKGIRRGLKLIVWGYILRFSFGVFLGYTHQSFFYTDVLHIIGLSIILLCFLYLLLYQYNSKIFNYSLLFITVFSFLFERYYNEVSISFLPNVISHYFTKANGAVFSLFPWFGYVSFGAFLVPLFNTHKEHKNFYKNSPVMLFGFGLFLLFLSSPILLAIGNITKIEIFSISGDYNYLFSRLGDVLIIFSFFLCLRNYLKHPLFIKIGKVTLSIYIVHHIILYGSWFHTGLTRWFYNSLNFPEAILSVFAFVIIVCFLVLNYRDYMNDKIKNIELFLFYKLSKIKNVFNKIKS
jgi:uncharacterized membrane protein